MGVRAPGALLGKGDGGPCPGVAEAPISPGNGPKPTPPPALPAGPKGIEPPPRALIAPRPAPGLPAAWLWPPAAVRPGPGPYKPRPCQSQNIPATVRARLSQPSAARVGRRPSSRRQKGKHQTASLGPAAMQHSPSQPRAGRRARGSPHRQAAFGPVGPQFPGECRGDRFPPTSQHQSAQWNGGLPPKPLSQSRHHKPNVRAN